MRDKNPSKLQPVRHVPASRKKSKQATGESEEKYRQLFDFAPIPIALIDGSTLRMLEVNEAARQLYGFSRKKNVVYKATEFSTEPKKVVAFIRSGRIGESAKVVRYNRRTDGTVFPAELYVRFFSLKGRKKKLYYVAIVDLTERKEVEKALEKGKKDLEEKSRNLEEVNAALKVVLLHRENEKNELEEKIIANVRGLVSPYIEKLMSSGLNGEQMTLVNILERNLSEILSPFLTTMKSKYSGLSPRETEIAGLIRNGRTTKEIAQLLGVGKGAIDLHRYSIRKKLGLNKAKVNLCSFLSSLS